MGADKRYNFSRILVVLIILMFSSSSMTAEGSGAADRSRMSSHISFLASDSLEGRKAGTPFARKAAEYIAREFIEYGLFPHPDSSNTGYTASYLQPFSYIAGVEMTENNTLYLSAANKTYNFYPNVDFKTLPVSTNEKISGEVIFAGFGISAQSDGYDDYADTDAEGRIVMVIQGSPDIKNPGGVLNRGATLRHKINAAVEAGAKALIIVTDPHNDGDSFILIHSRRHAQNAEIPVINITADAASVFFGDSGEKLQGLYDEIIENRTPNSFKLKGITAHISTELYKIMEECNNVIAFLPGSDPDKANEVIVLGAHYDHLGRGGPGSLVPGSEEIHYGADDNASGTAGMLELARLFSESKITPLRSLMFIAFGAEELGLIGSRHYVEYPYIPNNQTVAMLNLDMIGRLRNNEIIIFGIGTSPVWDDLLENSEHASVFNITRNLSGAGPSDHAPFYGKGIPVLFFHTGLHGDYHRPSDTADKIEYRGLEKIINLVYEIARELAMYQDDIIFTGSFPLTQPEHAR